MAIKFSITNNMTTNNLLTKAALKQALPKYCKVQVRRGTGNNKNWTEAIVRIPHADGCACSDEKAEVFALCPGCRFERNRIVKLAYEAVAGIEYETHHITPGDEGHPAIEIKVHFLHA